MTPPLVSCVVPVFNGERYLGVALNSIAAQTYRHTEIIVIDDGSTDGTPAVAETTPVALRYLRQANAGPAAARNAGIREAAGDLIAFLDADDLWPKDRLTRIVDTFLANPSLDIVVGHAVMFEDSPEAAGLGGRPVDVPIPAYITSGFVARRSAFARVGPFSESLKHSDSTDWFVRARALHVAIELIPDVVLRRRLHTENISRVDRTAGLDEFLGLIKRKLDRQRGTGV